MPSYWLFQADPERYDVDAALQELDVLLWRVHRYAPEIGVGDRVVLWRAGLEAGIVGGGTVIEPPADTPPPPEELRFYSTVDLGENGLPAMRAAVRVQPVPLVPEVNLIGVAQLRGLPMLLNSLETVFPLEPDQWRVLERLAPDLGRLPEVHEGEDGAGAGRGSLSRLGAAILDRFRAASSRSLEPEREAVLEAEAEEPRVEAGSEPEGDEAEVVAEPEAEAGSETEPEPEAEEEDPEVQEEARPEEPGVQPEPAAQAEPGPEEEEPEADRRLRLAARIVQCVSENAPSEGPLQPRDLYWLLREFGDELGDYAQEEVAEAAAALASPAVGALRRTGEGYVGLASADASAARLRRLAELIERP